MAPPDHGAGEAHRGLEHQVLAEYGRTQETPAPVPTAQAPDPVDFRVGKGPVQVRQALLVGAGQVPPLRSDVPPLFHHKAQAQHVFRRHPDAILPNGAARSDQGNG